MTVLVSANNNGLTHYLAGAFPGSIGWVISPATNFFEPRSWLPYVVDNGKYSDWKAGKMWDETRFLGLLDRCKLSRYKPMWIVVPDEVGKVHETESLWHLYESRLRRYEWSLAYVVQDGCDPRRVPKAADIVFVGGTTNWKWRNAARFAAEFPRVHVGRVNSHDKLEYCERLGVESVDGSGFFREGEGKRVNQLVDFISGHRRHDEQPQLYEHFKTKTNPDTVSAITERRDSTDLSDDAQVPDPETVEI
jgi:hypothetical protein